MPYIRRISAADAVDAGYPDYLAVMPVGIESATVVSGYLGDGAHPPLHVHDVDQFFFVVSGSAIMWLAHDAHETKPGELIYIPAGYPHGSSNDSGATEHHLEIMVPGVRPGAPYLRSVESADAVQLPAVTTYIRSLSDPVTEANDQERRWVLADESTGIHTARITGVEWLGQATADAPASRETDRLIVVTEGRLDTEIAGQPGQAAAESVIVIPAGVPHRIQNASSAPVRYLDIDLQTPAVYAKLADPAS
jgi:quercetin dioxygenase-like cupin family protein